MSKVVAICGASYFSADPELPGQSFAEVMCSRNDWKLWSLARCGCSNFAISLQVDKAIELGVDVVVIGSTSPDRCEFPIINEENFPIWERLKKLFNWKDWGNTEVQPNVYDKPRGISNVWHTNSLSGTYPWISNPTIISESLNNLVFSNNYKLNTEQLDALRGYMLNLYDSGIKRQIDSWIISDACRRLEHAKIPYLIFIEELYNWNFLKDIGWVPENNIIRPTDFSIWNDLPRGDTLFHYSTKHGSPIFADYVESRIKKLNAFCKDEEIK